MANKKRQSNITPEMLIEARVKAGLTQDQAAKVIGKSRRSYVYYETGVIFAKKEHYDKIVGACK